MPTKSRVIPDDELVALISRHGLTKTAKITGLGLRGLHIRRRRIELRTQSAISPPQQRGNGHLFAYQEHDPHIKKMVKNGVVLVGGDPHYWPGPPSLMHRAFVLFCRRLKPAGVVMNGDVNDFGRISRHQRIGWEKLPEVADEIEVGQERLGEIEKAAFHAWKVWGLGNHDARYSTRLANFAPEYAGVNGTKLRDHYPLWEPCWESHINTDVICRHRDRGGKHDAYTTALHAGCTVVIGHSHSSYVRAITDARGTRWGVNHGCLADPNAQAFTGYTEGKSYKDWRAAFAVLTFKDGKLLPPELVEQWSDNEVTFRGEVIKV